jgi:hypothetical protein
LVKAAYGPDFDASGLAPGLKVAATALNAGDVGRAMVAALQLKLPELDREAAMRVARTGSHLAKYDPNEPRDWHGRWTTGNGGGSRGSATIKPRPRAAARTSVRPRGGRGVQPPSRQSIEPDHTPRLIPASFETSPTPPLPDRAQAMQALRVLQPRLESKFDDSGPIEFARAAYKFGDWLEVQGLRLSPAQRADALAEYVFLQNRITFWLGYDYTPATAKSVLIATGDRLHRAAYNSRIIDFWGGLPRSMGPGLPGLMAYDGAQPGYRPQRLPDEPAFEEHLPVPPKLFGRLGELGGVADNNEVHIIWNGGIIDQGDPWEVFFGEKTPQAKRRLPGAKVFDYFDQASGLATSAKTLNTVSVTYIRSPQKIYGKLAGYIDAAANYKPRAEIDVSSQMISAKEIQLAVPESTSPAQWGRINRAVAYAKSRGIKLMVTRIIQ